MTARRFRVFILAGMDTTSNALSRTLQVLAEHPEEQEKLRAEIQEARDSSSSDIGQDISYDDLVKLPYLDAICRETLRLYAPVQLIFRRYVCVQPVSKSLDVDRNLAKRCEGYRVAAGVAHTREGRIVDAGSRRSKGNGDIS